MNGRTIKLANETYSDYLAVPNEDLYDETPFGKWMTSLWSWGLPNWSFDIHKNHFFLLLERLLCEGKVVFSPPEEFWSKDLGTYDAPMRQQANWNDVWDIPIEDQIAYIRDHFPKDVTDANDIKINSFFYDNYCPRIGWIHPETGEIISS